MSIKLMTAAWDSSIPSTEKMVLLCLCDFADDEGRNCYPSIATIAKKTSKNERTVQRALRWLEDNEIVTSSERSGTSTNYQIHPRHFVRGDILSGVTKTTNRGGTVSPRGRHGVTLTTNEPLEPPKVCASPDALKPEHILEHWNDLAGKLGKPKARDLTPERRQLLKARIAQYSIDDFVNVFGKIERSPFLRGEGGWRGATFDWIFKKANFQKTLEGNYDN
jgi:DNA-binding transcriptional ArsR family regulator